MRRRRRARGSASTRRRERFGRFGWGVFGIVFLVVLVYAVFTKLSVLSSSFTLHADFTTAASQIEQGSPVRIAGVNVGKVTAVGRGPDDGAAVTMAIDSNGLPIHTDATMKIRPRLFLEGNFFIDLFPGSPSAPVVKDGATIPLSQTSVPVQIDQVLDMFTEDPRTGMQQVIHGFGQAVNDGGAVGLQHIYRRVRPDLDPARRGDRGGAGRAAR